MLLPKSFTAIISCSHKITKDKSLLFSAICTFKCQKSNVLNHTKCHRVYCQKSSHQITKDTLSRLLFTWTLCAHTGLLALLNGHHSDRSVVVNRATIYACPYSGQLSLELTTKITDDNHSGFHITVNEKLSSMPSHHHMTD